ncbi:DUF3501 family protein [Aquabacterium sp.]|uniref:DUF3501 family protein n=1 Tax=Aquabacterium sp. TaxID=1872578 RepID=UPI002BC5EE6C|nr:DUF3501 family protein [Aquabacterium sp.]HSW04535.1 DUF3501 family protein [Aquabacterium sp.]
MNITVGTLMSLQSYSLGRRARKQQLIRHRRERSVALGPCMRLQFEDEQIIRYQIQEVLHVERLAHPDAVQHEIDTYAHLVPDGSNWTATLMIELPDAGERRRELPLLNEAAHAVYVDVPRHARVVAQANEDQPDRHLTRPSAVHFLRFQLPESLRAALLGGAPATLGCAHCQYEFRRVIPTATIERLRRDLMVGTHKLDGVVSSALLDR